MRKRGRPPYPDILTPREWEVLALLRDGLTNEQIAGRLGITRHAVRYHVSEILSKLGVSSRQEAAAWQAEKAKPAWMGALAFVLWPLKHLPFGVAAKASAAAVAIAAAGGIGFLAWGFVVTSREDNNVALIATPTATASPVSANTSRVSLEVSKEMDRVTAAVGAGSIPEESECSWGTTAAAEAYILTELLVACGPDREQADFMFQDRGPWDGDQPPPDTVPPKVFDDLRQMIDFVLAGNLQPGQTAVLWYNVEVADSTWFVLEHPRVLDVVDAEINRLIEANWLDYSAWFSGRSDVWYESHYDYFTGELRVAIGPSQHTADTTLGWPSPPWPVPQPMLEVQVPTEKIAAALHELVGSILGGGLEDGETAVLWYKPQTDEVLAWTGSNPGLNLFWPARQS